ncbi:MAG: trehalose-phosphatase [Bryobacteraceae bacterium]
MIESALACFEEIEQRLASSETCTLFLDFDGTLAPIVSDPRDAFLDEETRGLLHELNGLPGMRIAVISGREVGDLQTRVDLDLIYAGDHGLEIRGQGLRFAQPDAVAHQQSLVDLVGALRNDLAAVPGVLVERKGFSASVHYRNSLERDVPFIRRVVERHLWHYPDAFILGEGKKVFELRPNVNWNKGKCAAWILEQTGQPDSLCVCLGDDETDEDLFVELPQSLTVRVGAAPWTAARYILEETPDVLPFLSRIRDIWSRKRLSANGDRDRSRH